MELGGIGELLLDWGALSLEVEARGWEAAVPDKLGDSDLEIKF